DPRPRLTCSHDQTNDRPSRRSHDQQLLLGPLRTVVDRGTQGNDLTDPCFLADLLEAVQRAVMAGADPVIRKEFIHLLPDDEVDTLKEMDAQQILELLIEQAIEEADLTDPFSVSSLLDILYQSGAQEAAVAVADRAAQESNLREPFVSELIKAMKQAGAQQATLVVANRAADETDLDHLNFADLVEALAEAGAQQAATAVIDRIVRETDLTNPYAVANLLKALTKAGARQALAAVIDRIVRETDLTNPYAVANLLKALTKAGAQRAIEVLSVRARDAGGLHSSEWRPFGRDVEGGQTKPWTWDDLELPR
ncbi:hypothetical protein ACWGKW_41995, partial [Streptomyces sp. NPDC054766]